MAALDQDKVICVSIRNDTNLASDAPVFAQAAMLHTDMYGERKIRIFNYSWVVSKNLHNYCKSSDVESVAQFRIRNHLTQVTKKGAKSTREKVINDLVTMLSNYRSLCSD